MSRKSPSQLKILNDTLDLMTLMTHAAVTATPELPLLLKIVSPCA